MKTIRRFVLILAVLGLGSTIASASSIFTDTFFFGPTTIAGVTSISANLLKFDDDLLAGGGALQNIAFILSVTDVASASATNAVLTVDSFGVVPGGPLNVTLLGGTASVSAFGPSGMNTSTAPT